MSELRQVTLGDICDKPTYGAIASGSDLHDGPLFVRQTDLSRGRIDWSSVPRCDLDSSQVLKYAIERDDILVSRLGTVGRSARVTETHGAVYAGYLVRFQVDRTQADPAFVAYQLQSPKWWAHVDASRSGAVQPTLNAKQMAAFEFDLPNMESQRAIAEVLGALDDKIAANARLVEMLDSLRRARLQPMLDDAEPRPLSDIAEFVNGRAFTKNASGTGRVVIRIAELNSGLGGSTVYNDIDVDDKHLARPGDLLFAWSGSLTVHRWYRPEAIVNQHIFKVIPKDGYPMWCVSGVLQRKLAEFRAIAADKATTMGHIQRRHLDEPVLVPRREVIKREDSLMSGLWQRALAAEVESERLAATRDALLPLLMSGTVTVKDAESVVEEAV